MRATLTVAAFLIALGFIIGGTREPSPPPLNNPAGIVFTNPPGPPVPEGIPCPSYAPSGCVTRPTDPSQTIVYIHPGDPSEDPDYGPRSCREFLAFDAPGSTCTVAVDGPTEVR